MIRNILLTLSENKFLTSFISRNRVMSRFSHRFIAGESLSEAIEEIKGLNNRGIKVTIDHLGENVENRRGAEEATRVYLDILESIKGEGLDANVSVKLTQLGLDIGLDFCRDNLLKIAEKAKRLDNFVRIDMESSEYTDRTLEVFRTGFKTYGNVGIVIQSYLFRSESDTKLINEMNARVRLCKGAYKEPGEIAFPRKKDVDKNFLVLTQLLLKNGTYSAIATHDEKMIEGTRHIAKELGIQPDKYEFQMLYGIRRDLQQKLVDEGYTMRVYIAYGKKWAPYFMRRLAERPANLFFLLKNIIRYRG
jgi:proline dehydrogenase